MTFGSLFSGCGGMDLGLERAGLQCRFQIEVDPFCRKILTKHWPHVKRYGDIRTVNGRDLEPVDLLAGGFPCQDLSQAGKRAGIEGARSGLWFEFARIVGELRPRYVLVENVPGLLVYDGLRRVIGELSRFGYVGIWRSLRASEFGASHLRKRVFIIAVRDLADAKGAGRRIVTGSGCVTASQIRREVNDGRTAPQADGSGTVGSDVAHRESGGLGELREPSGSRGLADGSGEALAYGNGRRCQESIDGRERTTGDGQAQPAWRMPDVAHSPDNGRSQRGTAYDTNGHHASRHDTDGCDTAMAYANGGQRQQLRRPVQNERDVLGPEGGRKPLDNPASTRCSRAEDTGADRSATPAYGIGSAEPERRRGALADTGNGLLPLAGRGPQGRDGAGPGSEALGHADDTRLEGWRDEPGEHAREWPAGPSGAPLEFAPGPSDPRWPSILRERPDLAPALPKICGISDGIPDRFHGDIERAMSDRTKRLGRLGNAVVPQVAEWLGQRILAIHHGL